MLDILNVGKLNSQVKDLKVQLADWNSKYTQLEQAYENLKSETQESMTNKEDYEVKLESVKKEYNTLVDGLNIQHNSKITELVQSHTEAINTLKVEHEKAYNELKNGYEVQIKNAADNTLKVDEAANVKAAEIVANIGIEQGIVKADVAVSTSPQEVIKTYQDLLKSNPQAAVEYYKEHRNEIIQSVGFRVTK